MAHGFESILNEAMAELEKQRASLTRLHAGMEEVTGSARSKRRQVSVSVDARGDITELKFHGTAYRSLSPAELADIIVETIREAKQSAQSTLAESLRDVLPADAEVAEIVSGRYDWGTAFGDALTLPQPLVDLISGLGSPLFDEPAPRSTVDQKAPAS